MTYTLVQKYDLSKLKPIVENNNYALYTLGYVKENIKKGIRLDKKTNEQVEVLVQITPKLQVIKVFSQNKTR